jgi:hypothetical protein
MTNLLVNMYLKRTLSNTNSSAASNSLTSLSSESVARSIIKVVVVLIEDTPKFGRLRGCLRLNVGLSVLVDLGCGG